CPCSVKPAWSAPIAIRTRRDFTIRFGRPPRRVRARAADVREPDVNPVVVISARGEERLRAAHPWVYRADVVEARAQGGDVVSVRGPRGRTIGRALYSDRSQIALRAIEYGDRPDQDWLRHRIESALEFRASLGIDAT